MFHQQYVIQKQTSEETWLSEIKLTYLWCASQAHSFIAAEGKRIDILFLTEIKPVLVYKLRAW
jgi:hypothetical protein